MMNAKEEILELIKDEEIEAICIGTIGSSWDESTPTFYPKQMVQEGLKELDFEFDDDFGGEEGYRLLVWTPTKVIIKSIYDGSEEYEVVPRNPEKMMPRAYGG